MSSEDIDKVLDNLKARVKNMSNRELLENIYIILQLNTLSTNSTNSMPNIQAAPQPLGMNNIMW